VDARGAPSTRARTRWMFGSNGACYGGGVGEAHAEGRLLAAEIAYRCHNRFSSLQVACRLNVFDGRGATANRQKVSILRHDARETLVADDVRASMLAFRDALKSHQQLSTASTSIRSRRDTGTNMALTLDAVANELESVDAGSDMAGCARRSATAPHGARGNSGSSSPSCCAASPSGLLPWKPRATDVAEALVSASDLAQKAVVRPVEGTILTVARAAGEGASVANTNAASLLAVLEGAQHSAADALAGPRDARGAGPSRCGRRRGHGYLLLLDALLHVIDGRPLPVAPLVGSLPCRPRCTRAGGGVGTSATRSCTS